MIHQKLMIVDRLWTVVGTTNLDMLSFEYLDEINLAVRDEGFARDAQCQHDADLAESIEMRRYCTPFSAGEDDGLDGVDARWATMDSSAQARPSGIKPPGLSAWVVFRDGRKIPW